jgi:hypothetical protein
MEYIGAYGFSPSGTGVEGYSSGRYYGVEGVNSSGAGDGVIGIDVGGGTGTGVSGSGGTTGVYGTGNTYGVYGIGGPTGVYGNGSTYGVYGFSSQYGVWGAGSYGVYGMGVNYGVVGAATGGPGVYGTGMGAGDDFLGGGGEYLTSTGLHTSSDERLKKDIVPISGSLAKLEQLTPVTYEWKDTSFGTKQQIGLIAQNVQTVFPQLVEANASGTLSLNYANLAAPIIDAIKELDEKITAQQQDITAQDQEIDSLESQMKALAK